MTSRAVSARTGWSVAGLAALIALGWLVGESSGGSLQPSPASGSETVPDSLRCDPMTTEPQTTRATDPWGTRIDAEMILVDVSGDALPRDAVLEGRYGFGYSHADGADTQHRRDELRGSGYQTVHHSDEEHGAYDLGLIPTVDLPGYREMVVWRLVNTPAADGSGYADLWKAICGTVGFTVRADGSLSDARLVENPDAGTFEYGGQLR